MFNKDILLIDGEFSGLSAKKHDLIQLAAVLLDKKTLKEKKHFSTYIKPTKWANREPQAMAINQISWDQLRKAPSYRAALLKFNKAFGSNITLAYYVGINDILFLMEAYNRAKLKYPFDYHTFNIWAPIYIYMAKHGLTKNKEEHAGFDLEDCITHFKIKATGNLHDALVDTRIEAEILRKVIKGK